MTGPQPTIETASEIARALLRVGAFVFSPDEPFTWASGIQSPVYCDNRLVLGHPNERRKIVEAFCRVYDKLDPPRPELIVGTATAGIPHAAWLSAELELPMAYVRSSAKAHGRTRTVEGVVSGGQRALLVEDLVSTGGSSIAAVRALRASGISVDTVIAIFTYGIGESQLNFEAAGCNLITLTDLDSLLRVAVEDGRLDADKATRIAEWRNDL